MEKLLEIVLLFAWDAVKTLILQWLVDCVKDWWSSRKVSAVI